MRASLKALRQRESPAKCANTQLDLFNHSVLAHDVADAEALCRKPKRKARHTMQSRQLKGLEIAASKVIISEGGIWLVPSQASSKTYTVNLHIQTCTCADFEANRTKCKHIHAVEFALLHDSGEALPLVESDRKSRPTYKQEWREYRLAQVNEKSKFLELLYALCSQIEEPMQHMGRPRIPTSDRIFAMVFKVYSTISGRRFMSDLQEAKRRGVISMMPNFVSLTRYFESEEMTALLKDLIIESSLPLKSVESDFAVDSSGFSTGIYQKWSDAKWGKVRESYGSTDHVNIKDWLKVHIMCGCKTNVVTSVEITDAHAGDSPQFRPLVETTSQNFVMNTVCGDKAYSSNNNLKLVLVKGAQPYIDFKSNANATRKDKGQSSVWKRMFHLYQYNQEWFMQHYHKRSNVETTFSMIKRKFGERLRSKHKVAQINEVLCKILCHNLCCLIHSMYELGVEVDFSAR
jgi:transposase